MNKKLVSTILIVSMMVNMTIPHVAVFANDIESVGSQNKIVEQLKNDLGEEKATEIISVSKESVEYSQTSDSSNDENDNLHSERNEEVTDDSTFLNESSMTAVKTDVDNNPSDMSDGSIVEPENDSENGYVEEPEDDELVGDNFNDKPESANEESYESTNESENESESTIINESESTTIIENESMSESNNDEVIDTT